MSGAGVIDVAGKPPRPADGPSDRTYAVGSFSGARYVVVEPRRGLDVRLQRGADYYAISDQRTGVFGVGATPLEALDDLQRAAREHLDVLERQTRLSADLTEQREYLRERLGR